MNFCRGRRNELMKRFRCFVVDSLQGVLFMPNQNSEGVLGDHVND
jgi:hypothetical protein